MRNKLVGLVFMVSVLLMAAGQEAFAGGACCPLKDKSGDAQGESTATRTEAAASEKGDL